MSLLTEGRKSIPSSGTLLADTGPLAGTLNGFMLISSTVPASVILQHRNAANDDNIVELYFDIPSGFYKSGPYQYELVNFPIDNADERYRIVLSKEIAGDIQATIVA